MWLVGKVSNVLRGLRKQRGTSGMKSRVWNQEYASGRWSHCNHTPGAEVYRCIEAHARGGRILDLGCGAGNTGNEISPQCYCEYIGVDISDVAVANADERSVRSGRGESNRYLVADIETFVPEGTFNVILFRESIYYVPPEKLAGTLERYRQHLIPSEGVFVAELSTRGTKHAAEIASRIEELAQTSTFFSRTSTDYIIVFR